VSVLLVKLCAAIGAGIAAWRIGAIEPKRYNRAWIYVAILICVVALDFAMPRYLGNWRIYSIPTSSNVPTLIVGDYVMSEKGYYRRNDPQRGDMAIFKLPTDTRVDYIKRVVGLPGDTIQMVAGRLHINGIAMVRERLPDEVEQLGATEIRVSQYIETLPEGRQYRVREERGDDGMLDNTSRYTVPDGHYFVLGDNRDNSQDSRILTEVGFVPRENFQDRPTYVFWSRDRSRVRRRVQ
jgi:signal peptidase I